MNLWALLALVIGGAGAFVFAFLKFKQAGEDKARAEQLQRTAEAQERMADADARGPRNARDVDKRLSDGTF